MNMKNIIYTLSPVLGLLLFLNNVSATLMLKELSTDEMVQRSDTIAIGTVKDIEYKTNDKNQTFTYTTIECQDTYKGNKEIKTFQIIQIGGKTATYTTAVYGAPSYAISEKVIVFLQTHREQETLKQVIGLSQGKYSIIEDETDGEKYAVSDMKDICFLEEHGHKHGKISKIPLETFIQDIKESVKKDKLETAERLKKPVVPLEIKRMGLSRFNWIKWIKQKVVYYSNEFADKYDTHIAKKRI